MTRRMIPAPPDTILVKTSHATWVALAEEWSADGRTLLALHPMREPPGDTASAGAIRQAHKRYQSLLALLADREAARDKRDRQARQTEKRGLGHHGNTR